MGNAGSHEVTMEKDLGQFVVTGDGIKLSTSVLERLAGTEQRMVDSYEKVINEQDQKIQTLAKGWATESSILKKELQKWQQEISVKESEYHELKLASDDQAETIDMLKSDLLSWEDIVSQTKESLAKAQNDSKKWAAEAEVRSQLADQLKSSLEKAQSDKNLWESEAESRSKVADQLKDSLAKAQADSEKWASEAETRNQLAEELKQSLSKAQAERSQLADQLKETLEKAEADSKTLTAEVETRSHLAEKLQADLEALKNECVGRQQAGNELREELKHKDEWLSKLQDCELSAKNLVNDNEVWKTKVSSSEKELKNLQEQYTNLNNAYVAVQNLVVDKEGLIAEMKTKSEQTLEELEKWKSESSALEVKTSALQGELENKNLDCRLMENKAAEYKLAGDKLEAEALQSQAEQKKLKDAVADFEINTFKLQEQVKSLGMESVEMKEKVDKCVEEIETKANEVEKWKSDFVSERAKWIERREMVSDEFQSVLSNAESKFQKPLLKPICQHLQSALVNCYKNNPSRVLDCSAELFYFKQCVEDAKRSLINK